MTRLTVTLAATVTDRSLPVLDGRIAIAGCDVVAQPGEAQDIFRRTLNERAFDIAEMSMSSWIVAAARGDEDYVAIPVFLSRSFRHSSIYIRKDRAIASGADLAGKRIGTVQWQQTAGVWARGILREHYGLDTATVHWRTGGLDRPDGAGERTRIDVPNGLDLQAIAEGRTLNAMLVDGELDAVMVPNVPSSLTTHPDRVGRLFPDYVTEEKQYFRATGIFPIMHTVLIRRALCASHPWLAAEVYNAFARAKAQALKALTQININRVSLAWVADDAARTRAVLGDRMWAYGLPASRHELEALLRHADADGLLATKMAPEDLFDPSTHSLEDVN